MAISYTFILFLFSVDLHSPNIKYSMHYACWERKISTFIIFFFFNCRRVPSLQLGPSVRHKFSIDFLKLNAFESVIRHTDYKILQLKYKRLIPKLEISLSYAQYIYIYVFCTYDYPARSMENNSKYVRYRHLCMLLI